MIFYLKKLEQLLNTYYALAVLQQKLLKLSMVYLHHLYI